MSCSSLEIIWKLFEIDWILRELNLHKFGIGLTFAWSWSGAGLEQVPELIDLELLWTQISKKLELA